MKQFLLVCCLMSLWSTLQRNERIAQVPERKMKFDQTGKVIQTTIQASVLKVPRATGHKCQFRQQPPSSLNQPLIKHRLILCCVHKCILCTNWNKHDLPHGTPIKNSLDSGPIHRESSSAAFPRIAKGIPFCPRNTVCKEEDSHGFFLIYLFT